MVEIASLTIKVDIAAIAGLHDRIAALVDVVSEGEATALIDCADELLGQNALFLLTLDKATDVAVMETNPEFLARVAALEAKYGF